MEKEIVLGNRKPAPLGLPIVTIACFSFCFICMLLLYFIGGVEFIWLLLYEILCVVMIFIMSLDLISKKKSRNNTLPFAKFKENDEEIEFYSILATSLKIKKEKIYEIKVHKNGLIQIFFVSDINQKLMFNCGYFFDANKCKIEIKKVLKQDIK